MKKILIAILILALGLYFNTCCSNGGEMTAEIITIGDEILIGQIIDTNSSWIAEKLNLHDIEIYQITSVHDDPDHIKKALKRAEERSDLVILTGGLGPTIDDMTKPVLTDYFKTRLVFHEPTFQNIKKLIEKRGIPMNRFNRDQALVPESSTVLPNKTGTAPGLWFEKDNIIFVALPGVPYEMKHIMENEVLPRLHERKRIKAIYHKTVLTQGLPESVLSEKLEEWEDSLPENIKLAYLPDLFAVRMRLSAVGTDKNMLRHQVENEIDKLKTLIPENIFGYDNQTMAGVIGEVLAAKNKTLGIAEGSTGGYISHLINSDPQCRKYYKGGINAYSDKVKYSLLRINPEITRQYGEVSEQVALEMVCNVKELLETDYAIATTGIAGPEEDVDESRVGTVWIAVASPHETISKKFVFDSDRERNIILSAQTALHMLKRMVSETKTSN